MSAPHRCLIVASLLLAAPVVSYSAGQTGLGQPHQRMTAAEYEMQLSRLDADIGLWETAL